MTERANTPKLRFPEFNNDWTTNQAKNLFTNVSDKKHDGDLLVLSATQDKGMVPRQDLDLEIKYDKKNLSNYKRTLPNDFIISLRSFQGGFELNTIEGIVSPAYTVLRGEEELAQPKFFKQYFKSIRFIKKLDSMIYGIRDGKSISYKEFSTFSINYPSILEQQKIGDFFSKLDRQIELEEQKLAKLEEQKKGYMQKLFSQEIRFKDNQGNNYPDWKIVEIGDILEERTERSGEGDMLSVTINNGIIKFDEIDRKDNSSKDKSNYRKVYKDDIAYNSMRMWQGASGKSEYEGIVSPAYTVTIPSENINPDFIAYYFKTHKMIHKFKINSQGLTSDTWNLKYRQLKDIKLNLCSKEEQNKIANLLIMYDKLINKQKHKLEILKTNKKGFLQKMFV
ncbi:restriction endonuclease subunit S [Staphylococcus gallinarum]|uniref:restriction endonuclease subunit S n=1 Tax=Staphylococcus gallinarum TaxID=1293 RepID=UPI00317063C6